MIDCRWNARETNHCWTALDEYTRTKNLLEHFRWKQDDSEVVKRYRLMIRASPGNIMRQISCAVFARIATRAKFPELRSHLLDTYYAAA